MTSSMRRAFVVVMLLCCAAPAAAQQPEKQEDTQDAFDQLFGGGRRRQAQQENTPPPERREPTPAERQAAAAAVLDKQIASLEASLASMTPPALTNVAAARERATVLRQRVDRVRKELSIPGPRDDQAVGQTLAALQARWGDLAADIVQGRVPEASLDAGRWNGYARGFNKLYCTPPAVPAAAPATGISLVGYTWACLSDLFVHELAPIEARVARALDVKRAMATEPLANGMATLETLVTAAERLDPVPRFALGRIAEHLLTVERLATELRIAELKAQRKAGNGDAAFRWLRDLGRAVRRPSTVPALTITLGAVQAEMTLAPKPQTAQQSKALYQAHYRYALLDAGVTAPADARTTLDEQRARALAALAQAAQ